MLKESEEKNKTGKKNLALGDSRPSTTHGLAQSRPVTLIRPAS